MLALQGLGALSRSAPRFDLLTPGQGKEVGDHWTFGRSTVDDLAATADEVAAAGIRYTAAGRQAALERLGAEFAAGQHSASLDDARTVSPDVETFSDPDCQALMLVVQGKIDRLRQPESAFTQDLRNWLSASIAQILDGPALQWRSQLSAKFQELATSAHEFAIEDCLRDIGPDHPTCSGVLLASRLAIARERFS